MLVVAVVILAGVVAVASGRGGEMAVPEPDYPPIDLGPVSAADVALLRPPSAAWGYNMRVTDEALEVIARAVTDRDVQIAALQQQVSDLRERLVGGDRPADTGDWPVETASWPAEGPERDEGETEPAFAASSLAAEAPPATEAGDAAEATETAEDTLPAGYEDTVPPGYPPERDDQLPPAEQAEPGATAEAAPATGEPGHEQGPVAITRPQPIVRGPAGQDEEPGPGAADTAWDQAAVPATDPSAPWGPAQAPGGQTPPEAHLSPEAPAAPETPTVPDDHGWSTDPADTSPDAKPLDWAAGSPGAARPAAAAEPGRPAETTQPAAAQPPADPGPATGQAGATEPEPTDWDGRSQPSPAPSVWDMASRQVDEDQARGKPRGAGGRSEFIWDEDPHQTVVWGAEHARAKAARVAEETLPHAEPGDDKRG
jgi:hypothetical protein